MQRYYNFSKMLNGINKKMKYLLIVVLIIISTITIFELSSGDYLALMTKNKSGIELIIDVFKIQSVIVLAGLISYIISMRFNLLRFADIENFIPKFLISIPMYYLLVIYITQMNGLILIILIFMFYLLIINVNHLFMKRINYLYDISIGKILDDKEERSLEEVDVIPMSKENKTKKEKENKKYARKR